jgi:hypothetical protein
MLGLKELRLSKVRGEELRISLVTLAQGRFAKLSHETQQATGYF